ncbi:MAG: 50S ribosomal protein L13 [Patescibacteria group bacterium]|nr:50S ribosomal protein L13 [Patescibacteria group bacterium]MCL5095544.1 50S ribosomal protein L13 [Patescibacteria group bacterium]
MIKATSQSEIKQAWHLIDAQDQILGRLVTKIAALLMGKNKPYFVRYLDCGDYVVVVNAKQIKVTGQKEKQKLYYRYSGYPGGLRNRSLGEMRQVMPEKIIYEAVKGMLPQNKLRDRMLTRLYVYQESEHPYKDKFKS